MAVARIRSSGSGSSVPDWYGYYRDDGEAASGRPCSRLYGVHNKGVQSARALVPLQGYAQRLFPGAIKGDERSEGVAKSQVLRSAGSRDYKSPCRNLRCVFLPSSQLQYLCSLHGPKRQHASGYHRYYTAPWIRARCVGSDREHTDRCAQSRR